MERIRKEIEADPYAVLFGRRLEPFASNFGVRFENGFTSLWRSLFGLDKPENDTRSNIGRRAKEDSRSASGGDMRVTESEWAQSQPSPDSTDARFEFDPVSGRMVPKRPEDDYVIEGQAAAHGSSKDFDISSLRKAGANPHDFSKSDIVGSSNKEDITMPESSAVPEGTSGFIIAPQSQASNFAPTNKTMDGIPKPLEESQGAADAEPFQLNQKPEQPMPPDNDSYGALSNDNIVKPSQILDAEKTVSEKPVVEHHKEEGLDRAGFLSRRESENPTSTAIDEELDQLRANDIRAVYEPRRLSIASELEAEAPKDLGETSVDAVDVDNRNKPVENLNADSSAPSSEWSINTFLNKSNEQSPDISSSHHEAPMTGDASNAEVYRIFAYDPSSLSVTEAETTSSLRESSEHLHPAEVLTNLTNPAKFLPCLNQMHKEGYEIVSGGGDILVFRKTPETKSSTVNDTQMGDIPETIAEEHPDEAAVVQPAHDDFYTGNLPYNQSSTEQSHSKSAPKSRARKVLRRMFVSGVATAGTCYAIGVVSEYFRTGGVDGWGIDGFTEFESERRHMER